MRQSPPELALPYLERHEAKGSERAIIRFHHWMHSNALSIATLTASDPQRFFSHPHRKKSSNGGYYYRRVLGGYLFWLREIGLLGFDPAAAGLDAKRPQARIHQLPDSARAYLRRQGAEKAAPYLLRFHAWLDAKHIALTGVTAQEVLRFFEQPFRKVLIPLHASHYRRALSGYLVWLYDTGRLEFDPAQIGLGTKMRRSPLPEPAALFIQTLTPTIKLSSLRAYRSSLRQFYSWLTDAKISLVRLNRNQNEQWLMALHHRGIEACTRRSIILHIRAYLRWLAERGDIKEDPDSLIRSSDLPKLPKYLPRPLPPAIDRELQKRLSESTDPIWRGLCLMRQTGLRVGELLALDEDCVRTDLFDNRFLKVPLGKLDNERLVPLGSATYELLCSIKSMLPQPRLRLLQTEDGRRVPYALASQALTDAAVGLTDSKPITTHRLRHSYATELLSAGMSLVGIMKLLGHHSFHMTLRYAAVTQEHTGREYFAAMQKLEQRYVVATPTASPVVFDPIKAITDVVAWLHNNVAQKSTPHAHAVAALSKRLIRAQSQLFIFLDEKTTGKVAG